MAQNETLSVRRIPFYLFLILLGFLIFYVYDQVRKRIIETPIPFLHRQHQLIKKQPTRILQTISARRIL